LRPLSRETVRTENVMFMVTRNELATEYLDFRHGTHIFETRPPESEESEMTDENVTHLRVVPWDLKT
jgi:hypothetical protein